VLVSDPTAPTRSRRLVRSGEVADGTGWPTWFAAAHAQFRTTLLDADGYPCHFGVTGERAEHNWYTALDETGDHSDFDAAALANTLRDYAEVALTGPARQSLVVLVGPPRPDPDLDQDAARFWRVLTELSAQDAEPWPSGRPVDPGDPGWQWCFAGRPWFIFGASPTYRARRSRNLGPNLTLVFQLVERVFEGLSGSSVAGKAAKGQIRRRLADYDSAAAHPHLGDAQHSSTYKWRQYFLPDDDRILAEQACPWRSPTTDDGN
jgi:FPC/CPF motif-containing protein YcgG